MDTNRWFGTWIPVVLLAVAMTTANPDPYRRRFGDEVRRRRINVVTIQSDPYTILNWSPRLIGNERYEGYCVDIINQLADLAGFEPQLHLVADGKLGERGEEGGWTGMVGELLSKSADLTLGPLSITRERQTVIDFTSPILDVKLAILMSKMTQTAKASTQISPGSTTTIGTTLQELLSQKKLKFAALRNSEAVRALMTSRDLHARALYRRLQDQSMTSLMSNMYEALEFVRRQGYALLLDLPTAEYYMGREPCDLVVVTSFLSGGHYALATRKGDPILGEVNRALETLKGHRSNWQALRRKWWTSQCPGVSTGGTVEAGVTEINGDKRTTGAAVTIPTSLMTQPAPHLNVVAHLSAPFVMRSPSGALSGYTIDLLAHLARLVPFRYDITFPRDGAGFGKRKRSRWSGMTGEIVRGEVDLAAAPFTENRARNRVLSYTKPFLHSTLSILIRSASVNDEFPIFVMEDLLNQTDYRYGILRGSHLEKDLKNSREPVSSEIWTNILKNRRENIVHTLEEGIRKVRTERFALIVPSTYATYVSSKSPCDLMPVDQFMFITNYMFAVKKGNSLVDKMDEAMIKLQEDGILQTLFHKWWNTGECTGATEVPVPYGNVVKNISTATKGRALSVDRAYQLSTFSTKWQNLISSKLPLTTTVTTKPTPTTSEDPVDHYESTTEELEQDVRVSSITTQAQTETGDHMLMETTSVIMTVMTPVKESTNVSSSILPAAKTENREKHRHRHRHRDRERGRERGRGRKRERKRKRNRHSNNTTSTTEVSPISQQEGRGQHKYQSTLRSSTTLQRTTTYKTYTASTTTQPKLPVWDGKYIYEEEQLSTRSTENFTINLEVIPAEPDSIRIFPFTYNPYPGHRPPDETKSSENMKTRKTEYLFSTTPATPTTRFVSRGNKPNSAFGAQEPTHYPDIIFRNDNEKTDSTLLDSWLNPTANPPTSPGVKVVTYREETTISRAGSLSNQSLFVIATVCVLFALVGNSNAYWLST